MKRILTILFASVLTFSVSAQRRYHVENLTDYSKFQSSPRGQNRIGVRESAPLPCTGSPKIPVVLVQFSDKSFASDTIFNKEIEHSDENVKKFYERFCNGSGVEDEDYRFTIGSVGPVKDYFMKQSAGQFSPEFVIIGPITLTKSWQYYGNDTNSAKDMYISQFYSESLKGAINLGVDWTQFDNNKDGITDFVFFIYAGEGQNAYGTLADIKEHNKNYPDEQWPEEKANLIWPKEMASQTTVGGQKFGGCGCTNELYKSSVDGIGTMCHELSHGLGLPDFYDTTYNAFGLDYWDIMDSGNYCCVGRCPCNYSSYERDFMGWQKLETLNLTEGQTVTLEPISNNGKGYKLINPSNSDEYYILENRQSTGYDQYIGFVSGGMRTQYGKNNGLLIFHVDYLRSSWTTNTVNTSQVHQRLTILPADGQLITSINGYTDEYFKSMIGDLYPGANNITNVPSSRFKCFKGDNLVTEITKITQNEDGTVTVELNGGDKTAINDLLSNQDINVDASTIYDLSGRVVKKPSKGIYIKGGKKYFVK